MTKYKEFNKKYYNKLKFKKEFNTFEKIFISISKRTFFLSTYYYQFLKILFSLQKASKVLDLGIANGGFTYFMFKLRRDLKFYGLDITDVSDLLPKRVTFIKADVTKFKLKERFDLVVCNHLIEHLDVKDVPTVFKKVYDHLTDGGVFWVTVPSLSRSFYNDPTHVRPYTKNALQRLFYLSNFKDIKTFEGDYFNFPFNLIKNRFKRDLIISYGFGKK